LIEESLMSTEISKEKRLIFGKKISKRKHPKRYQKTKIRKMGKE
jgi:hypothetical protein